MTITELLKNAGEMNAVWLGLIATGMAVDQVVGWGIVLGFIFVAWLS